MISDFQYIHGLVVRKCLQISRKEVSPMNVLMLQLNIHFEKRNIDYEQYADLFARMPIVWLKYKLH